MTDVENGNARYGQQNVGEIFQGKQYEVIEQQLKEYEDLLSKKEDVENRIQDFKITNPDESNYTLEQKDTLRNLELELQSYDSTLEALKNSLYETVPNLETYKDVLNPTYDKEYIDYIDAIIDGYIKLFGNVGEDKVSKFDKLWNSYDFKNAKAELESLAKAGKLDADVFNSNEEYKKLLEATGATAEETAQHINSLVEAEDKGLALNDKTPISSFEYAWTNSFTSENDKVKELGDILLDLAEKGRLTKEIFEETDSTGYFKNLGISSDEAVSKINALVDESKQLSSMSDQISKMSNALGTKKKWFCRCRYISRF